MTKTDDKPLWLDPMPRQDLTLPPPAGYVTREDYDALAARLAEAETVALRAEVERLRGALAQIAADTGYNSGDQHHDCQVIARAAAQKGPTDDPA